MADNLDIFREKRLAEENNWKFVWSGREKALPLHPQNAWARVRA